MSNTRGTNEQAIDRLEHHIRTIKFGRISGVSVCDGRIQPDSARIQFTRKPRTGGCREAEAGSANLFHSLQDLRRDIEDLQGNWSVTIKVANSLPQSWDMESIGNS